MRSSVTGGALGREADSRDNLLCAGSLMQKRYLPLTKKSVLWVSSKVNDMKAFVQISRARMLHHYYPKIKTCLELLSEEEIWRIETPFDHSIGGIVEHIRLHIERNIARLDNPEIRFEKGIEESFDQKRLEKELFISLIYEVFIVLDKKLENSDSGMYDIYHLVEHTGYHVGQIVDRTKRLKGKVFDFVSEGINETNLKEKLKDEKDDFERTS